MELPKFKSFDEFMVDINSLNNDFDMSKLSINNYRLIMTTDN